MDIKIKPGDAEPDRIALQWLFATGLMACGALAFELPLWTSLVFVVGVAWRYAIERFHVYRPGRLVRYLLVALVVVGIYSAFGTILGRDPGLALLVSLLGLKLLELRSVRDAMLVLFLCYIVLVGTFLFEQTLPTGLWAIATVTVSVAALIRLQQPLPARAALRFAGGLLLKAIPLLVIMYLLFPRLGGTLWGLQDTTRGRSGLPDEVRAGTINELSLSSEIALRVDFLDGSPPPARDLYWRALVLTDTDGRAWRRGPYYAASASLLPQGAPVRHRVIIEPNDKRWLSALDAPVTTPPGSFMRAGNTLASANPVHERMSYVVTSYPRYTTRPLSASERRDALALPAVSARVQGLADSLRAQYADPAARAQALLEHIRRENFVYTLRPPLLGDDPVDQFLFETRRGFCEHYATAFATVMRAAGVPARVVIGYQGGELNPAGDYLIVRQSDAHGWVEVELPGRGWTRVDPTAAVAPERIEFGSEAIRRLESQGLTAGAVDSDALARALSLTWFQQALYQARLFWDYSNIAWYRFVVDYRKDSQENFLHALGFETIDWTRVLLILGGGCTLVLLAYVAWSRRAPPLDPVQRLYRRFCRKLARAGVTRAPHEGPLDFAERAIGSRPDLASNIEFITTRYLKLRYSTESCNDDLLELRRAVMRLRTRR